MLETFVEDYLLWVGLHTGARVRRKEQWTIHNELIAILIPHLAVEGVAQSLPEPQHGFSMAIRHSGSVTIPHPSSFYRDRRQT